MAVDTVPSVGRFEDAHGRQAELGETLTFVAVPDGVRPAEAVSAVAQGSPNGKPFTSETAREAARKRWELDKLPDFAKQELAFNPAEAFKPFDEGRRGLLEAKALEFGITFRNADGTPGAVDTGVMTTLRGYSWLVSFAEFWAVDAAKSGSAESAERARRFFKDASIELAKAHELMRAAAASRPRAALDLDVDFGAPIKDTAR
jgi:hypothetical protein